MSLHPEAEAYLKLVDDWKQENNLPSSRELGPKRLRRIIREAILAKRPPLPDMRVENRTFPARSGELDIRIIRPRDAGDEPLPTVLYFHGGGYVIGGIEDSAHEAYRLAQRTDAVVFSANYRKGPEHPFPAAVDDGYDALLWTARNAGRYGGDPTRLMVGGTSAGGGLASAVSRLAAVSRGPKISLTYLFCPWLDMTLSEDSVNAFAEGYGLDRDELEWMRECYIAGGDMRDPLASPALAPPPPNLPDTVIVAAECDPLSGEAHHYADRLSNAGVPTAFHLADGMVHAFNVLLHFIPAGEAHLAPIEAAMRRV
ncbi:MAG: alpha/beta hydrolase [Pseudomonadota bacterium]